MYASGVRDGLSALGVQQGPQAWTAGGGHSCSGPPCIAFWKSGRASAGRSQHWALVAQRPIRILARFITSRQTNEALAWLPLYDTRQGTTRIKPLAAGLPEPAGID